MVGHQFALYYHVVYIHFNGFAHLLFKHPSHHPLIGRPSILQAKGHHLIIIVVNWGDESSFFLVFGSHGYLMVALESVQETHSGVSDSRIYQSVYPRH